MEYNIRFAFPQRAANRRAKAQQDTAHAYFNPQDSTNEASYAETIDLTRVSTADDTPAPNDRETADQQPRRESCGQEQGRPIKKVLLDRNTRHLDPNFSATPKDAKPLTFPGHSGYDPHGDWKPHAATRTTMRSSTASSRGGVRPMNTLDQPAKHAAQNKGLQNNYTSNSQPKGVKSQPTQPPKRLKSIHDQGSNGSGKRTRERTLENNDEVERRVGREPKRIKAEIDKDEIDLTEEDAAAPRSAHNTFGETLGVVDRPSGSSQRSRDTRRKPQPPPRSDKENPFASDSFHGHNRWVGTTNGSASQTQLNHFGQSGSQISQSRRSQNQGSVSSRPLVSSATCHGHTNEQSRVSANNQQKDSSGEKTAERQIIDLENGLDEAGEQQRIKAAMHTQGSVPDIKDANNLVSQAMSGKATKQARLKDTKSQTRTQTSANTMAKQPSNDAVTTERNLQADTPMRKQFKREDTNAAGQPRKKLVQGMIASTTDSDDEDVLGGPPTIQGSRNSSPNKTDTISTRVSGPRNIDSSRRQPSPSDIKPTNFKQPRSQPKATSKKSIPKDVFDLEDDNNETAERIPVLAVFGQAFASNQKQIELVWNEHNKEFYIDCVGERVRTPDDLHPITIGKRDVNHGWHGNAKSLKAILRGSKSQHSNGMMLLKFGNREARDECFNLFVYAMQDKLTYFNETEDKIERIFSHQCQQLSLLHNRSQTKQKSDAKAITRRSLWEQQMRTTSEDEEIVYEDPSEGQTQPRIKARARMQGPGDSSHRQSSDFQGQGTASPYFGAEPTRRSTRKSIPAKAKSPSPPPPERWTKIHKPERWKHSVTYPAEGVRRVTVDFEDLEKLDEGEFLNDNIVNFELRYIEEHMSPEHRKKVHFFNTFFFSALSLKNGRRAFNYDAVSRWTKKIDIFNIPYIVVPVNVDYHWFVVIISNMQNLKRKPPPFGDEDDGVNDFGLTSKEEVQDLTSEASETQAAVNGKNAQETHKNSDIFEFGDDGKINAPSNDTEEREAVSSSPAIAATTKKSKKKKKKKTHVPQKYDTKEPILITMDSFGMPRGTELRYLKQYLCSEASTRRSMDLTTDDLQGMTAKGLPEQPDFHNCGVYLIGYITEFAKDPDRFVQQVLRREIDQNNDFANFNPSDKRDEIRNRILELERIQHAEWKAMKKAKAGAKTPQTVNTAATQPPSSSAPVPPSMQKPIVSTTKESQPRMQQSIVNTPSRDAPPAQREDDELPVSPPRAQRPRPSSRTIEAPSSTPAEAASSDEDAEMIDVLDEPGTIDHPRSSPLRMGNICGGGLPYGNQSAKEDLLTPFEKNVEIPLSQESPRGKSDDETQSDNLIRAMAAANRNLIVVDIGDEDESEQSMEVPDSQEQFGTKANPPKHIHFH